MKQALAAAMVSALVGACSSAPGPAPTGGAPDAAARGQAVAAQWCSACHTLAGTETDHTRAPTFEQIAQRPGRDAAYIRPFLDEDHFPMTTYRLLDGEKDDVTAMIVSLKK